MASKPCPLRLVTYRPTSQANIRRLTENLSRQLRRNVAIKRCDKCQGFHIRGEHGN